MTANDLAFLQRAASGLTAAANAVSPLRAFVPQALADYGYHDGVAVRLMAEWSRASRHSKALGRSHRSRFFCRAFHGMTPDEIRAVDGALVLVKVGA